MIVGAMENVSNGGPSDRIPAFVRYPNRRPLLQRLLWRWDDRKGERLSNIRYIAFRVWRAFLPWFQLGREILLEFYTLALRIGTLYRAKRGILFPYTAGQRDGERIHACIQDTQHIVSSHPWATRLDLSLCVQAWIRGAEWASASLDTQALHNEQQNTAAGSSALAQSTQRDSVSR